VSVAGTLHCWLPQRPVTGMAPASYTRRVTAVEAAYDDAIHRQKFHHLVNQNIRYS